MEVIKINNKKAVSIAAQALKNGSVIVCPTDTVYGFLADATNRKAVNLIFKIKKRDKSKPLPVFIDGLKMANKIAVIDSKETAIIKKYWPGKYTIVLPRRNAKIYGVEKKTIALRIPKFKFLNNILKKINKPIVQTSVNISGKDPLNKIGDMIKEFKGLKNLLIFDGGNLPKNKPSTVIDLTKEEIKILRK